MVMKSKINSTTNAAFPMERFVELNDACYAPRVNRFHAGCNERQEEEEGGRNHINDSTIIMINIIN